MRKTALGITLVLVSLAATFLLEGNPALGTAAAENSWETKAPMPLLEGVAGTAVVNGKIYAMGRSIHYEYDPETDKWTEKPPMPTPRSRFGIAAYQNKIYTIGGSRGWTQETGTVYSGTNEVYDPSTDTWETKAPMPTNRSEIVASAVCGKIHLIGPESHDVYDVATNSWTMKEPMPNPVYWFSATVVDNKIYVILSNLTQIYDTKSDSWSLGAPPLVIVPGGAVVCATTGVLAPKKIYVFGGLWGSTLEVIGTTQVYDPKSDTWTLGASMPTARAGPDAAVVNDVIYVIGGGYGWGYIANVNEQYIPFGYGTPDPSYVQETTPPKISVLSPSNQWYNESSVSLGFTADKQVNWTGYSLDGKQKVTTTGNSTINRLTNGLHNITVYANDTYGNMGVSETVSFTVAVPEPFPVMPVAAVAAVVIIISGVGLLVYFKKRKRQVLTGFFVSG